MVARALWTDPGPTKIQRSRTRDLSRQFRGEKAIEWRVVEVYVNLLFTTDAPARATQLESLRQLHVQAFGATVDPDGQPTPEPEPPVVDPAYVAELRRQLEEARTRAAFATALLVIVQAENTALRGRGASFDWFGPAVEEAGAPAADSRNDADSGNDADGGGTHPLIDPVTAPIVRRQGHRAGQRRRPGSVSGVGEAPSPGGRTPTPGGRAPMPGGKGPVHLSVAAQAPPSTLSPLARSRSVPAALHRLPAAEQVSDDLGLDILVGREKRRRGRPR